MRVVGITAEYDPMHTGHIYHLREAREVSAADFVVVVMSGDFTQRGEPALLDKWTRARIAAENGVDLVLELPFAYACNSAEFFAYGALEMMHRLGVVTHVAFGAESQDLQMLQDIAELLREEPEGYRAALRRELSSGRSFAAARGAAIGECLGPAAGTAAAAPNNLLAIEYLKFAGDMIPVLIPRTAPHHAEATATALQESAGAIRRAIFEGLGGVDSAADIRVSIADILAAAPIPENTREAILKTAEQNALGHKERFFDMLMSKLLTMSAGDLAQIFGVTEGMENRILDARRRCSDMGSLIEAIKTKRYPYTSISRMLMHTLVGFEKIDPKSATPVEPGAAGGPCESEAGQPGMPGVSKAGTGLYGHILAASADGRRLLRILKDDPRCILPLFGTFERGQGGETAGDAATELRALDIRAADLYNQATGRDLYQQSDFVKHPFMG